LAVPAVVTHGIGLCHHHPSAAASTLPHGVVFLWSGRVQPCVVRNLGGDVKWLRLILALCCVLSLIIAVIEGLLHEYCDGAYFMAQGVISYLLAENRRMYE
jgi:hypothetical protein